jgi:hypothetical protein
MKFTEDITRGLGIALNEANVLGVDFDEQKKAAKCTFATISVDKNGDVPKDRRVQIILQPVVRIISSLRLGDWNNPNDVVKFKPTELTEKIQDFGRLPIYGWEFFNYEKETLDWENQLSFDWTSEQSIDFANTLDLFQEGHERHLNIKIWFDEMIVLDPQGEKVEIQDFIDSGKKGWDAIYLGDDRTKGFGIIPSKHE